MSEQQRAVFRGGQMDGLVYPVNSDQDRFWFEKGDGSGSSGVYGRTDVVEQLPDGPAVRFESTDEDTPDPPASE